MAATRFPNKPLADIHGMPMIIHCYFRTTFSESIDEVYIATCDAEIVSVAEEFGANFVLTSRDHLNAVDRAAEASAILNSESEIPVDIVVLVQGDEPLLDPKTLDAMVASLASNSKIDAINAMAPFASQEDFMNPNNPKVIVDEKGRALYISREPIPTSRQNWNGLISHMQTGLFAFRPSVLDWFASTPRTQLEEVESIDMLRLIYHGLPLNMVVVTGPTVGVDTPEDLTHSISLMSQDPLFLRYKNRSSSA
jgi:3-deoxy-manno-octulosonate cytidylyltransferase (CMP-KDO synthetase)